MFNEIDKKLKIFIIIVMILSTITFALFLQDIQTKEINTEDDKNKVEEDKNTYKQIEDVKYCEKLDLKIYNETHCYS